jgi:hypothetical protein
MTSGVLCLLKGTDTSVNGILDPLNLILRLISHPNCPTGNLTNLGLSTLNAAGQLACQAFPYLFNGFRCEEHGKSSYKRRSNNKCNRRSHGHLHGIRSFI